MRSAVAVLALAASLAGCVHHPSIVDVGGTRIRPANGRVIQQMDGGALQAVFYVDLHSTGKFGDTLTAARTAVAREARLVAADGAPVSSMAIPGETVVALHPGGPRVVLSGLVRPLDHGEAVIVTLVFEKTGHLGVVSVVE